MAELAKNARNFVESGYTQTEGYIFSLFEEVSELDFAKLIDECAETEKTLAEFELKKKQEEELIAACAELTTKQVTTVIDFALAIQEGKASVGAFVLDRLEAERSQARRSQASSADRAKEAARSQRRRDQMSPEARAKEVARSQKRRDQMPPGDRAKEAARRKTKRAGLSLD